MNHEPLVKPITEKSIHLSDMGSFYVGGRKIKVEGQEPHEVLFSPGATPVTINPNGDYWVEQMYVQYFLPKSDNGGLPLLLWHGGGSTGNIWETTPDGRDGWLNVFLKLGWPVYCSDAVERGRSGWPCSPLDIWKEQPSRASCQDVRDRMRAGPFTVDDDGCVQPNADCQFPFESFDNHMKGNVPRWITTDEAVLAAYTALVERVGPCIILATSQGASFACRVAEARSDIVRGLVLVEPAQAGSGQPLSDDFRVPMLGLFGDYIETDPRWVLNQKNCRDYADAIQSKGAAAEVISLPEIGLSGNTHCMPCERNNAEIAGIIHQWLTDNVSRPSE